MSNINEKQRRYLSKAHERGRLSQAYLFVGPEKIGKFELVEKFVMLINGIDNEEKLENNPDIFIVEPEIEEKKGKIRKKEVSIKQTKEALKKTSYHAYRALYKIILIKEAESMTTSAANSLLKLIEEPKEDTIIILTSHKEQRILPTIRSRCQLVRFGLSNQKIICDRLEKEFPRENREVIKQCFSLSQGRIGLAREYVEKKELRNEANYFQEEFKKSLRGGLVNGFLLVEKVGDDRNKTLEMMNQWIWYLQEFLKKCVDDEEDWRVIGKVHEILKRIVELKHEIECSNVNHKLQLENFFVQLS